MNYQPNQILQSISNNATYYLVINVYNDYLKVRNVRTRECFAFYVDGDLLKDCTLVGTADSHPELLL